MGIGTAEKYSGCLGTHHQTESISREEGITLWGMRVGVGK